jgi:hypothetical protein
MKLNEILNTVLKPAAPNQEMKNYNLKMKSNTSRSMSAIFTAPNEKGEMIKYLAMAFVDPRPEHDAWEIAFVEADKNDNMKNIGDVMTGYNNAPAVYGAFSRFLEKFAQEKHPDVVHITSGLNEPKKVQFYRLMANRFASKFGYKVAREYEDFMYDRNVSIIELRKNDDLREQT